MEGCALVTLEHPRGSALPAVGGGGRADLRQHRVADPRLRRNTLDGEDLGESRGTGDRKSTRLNSSHGYISYAVFCLKKKKNNKKKNHTEVQKKHRQQRESTTNRVYDV